jgi:hypothetical protein
MSLRQDQVGRVIGEAQVIVDEDAGFDRVRMFRVEVFGIELQCEGNRHLASAKSGLRFGKEWRGSIGKEDILKLDEDDGVWRQGHALTKADSARDSSRSGSDRRINILQMAVCGQHLRPARNRVVFQEAIITVAGPYHRALDIFRTGSRLDLLHIVEVIVPREPGHVSFDDHHNSGATIREICAPRQGPVQRRSGYWIRSWRRRLLSGRRRRRPRPKLISRGELRDGRSRLLDD